MASGWSSERGSVTIMTAVLMVGLVLVLGLSIDVARIYMVRSGLQNAADAAALAAARELNSGTGGLTDAVAQANAIVNKYGFNRTGVTAPNVTISKVEFAPSLDGNCTPDGKWCVGAGAVPADKVSSIKFVRVTTQAASVGMLFAANALGATLVEQRTAVAGMSVPLNTICNFFPIAVALTNNNPANHAQFTLTFTDGEGSSVSPHDKGYIVLNTNEPGAPDTAHIAAGVSSGCASIGGNTFPNSGAQQQDLQQQIAAGANTRFDMYASPFTAGDASKYPPDTNIYNSNPLITGAQYLNKSPLTAPQHPGQDDRRIMIMPIIDLGTYNSTTPATIRKFGAFLLRSSVNAQSAALVVEYLGDGFVVGGGSYTPGGGSSTLSIPVLYK